MYCIERSKLREDYAMKEFLKTVWFWVSIVPLFIFACGLIIVLAMFHPGIVDDEKEDL